MVLYQRSNAVLLLALLQKLHVFLFEEVLVLTRAVAQGEQLCYQLYRAPLPVRELLLEELQDGELRLGGSIRGAFSNNERGTAALRCSCAAGGSLEPSHACQRGLRVFSLNSTLSASNILIFIADCFIRL